MKRIFSTSLLIIALCTQVPAQGGKQLSAENFADVTSVTSIPLSDVLAEEVKNPDNNLKKSRRELTAPDGDGSTPGEKQRYWVRAEYLAWRIRGSYLPPLAEVSSISPSPFVGEILIGGRTVNPGNSYGGRITAGLWLNRSRTVGLEASYFYLGPRSINQLASGSGEGSLIPGGASSPTIIRPYTSATFFTPPMILASPFLARGSLAASLAGHLQGAEINSVYDLGERRGFRLRLLGGFRFLDFKERLTLIENILHNFAGTLGDGSELFYTITDEFGTRNRFYGGQGGAQTEFKRGRLSLEFSGKVALGGTRQLANVGGSTIILLRNNIGSVTSVGGFLALETNIGRYERSRFAFLPEAKAAVGYRLVGNLEAFAGYDLLFSSRVARPSDQIDLTINWVRVPFFRSTIQPGHNEGPVRPAFSFRDSNFWAQGMTFGLRLGF